MVERTERTFVEDSRAKNLKGDELPRFLADVGLEDGRLEHISLYICTGEERGPIPYSFDEERWRALIDFVVSTNLEIYRTSETL